jgi:tetratricopeptide (TPR) repeat protein
LLGVSELDCGQFEEVERILAPRSAEAHFNLGLALFNLKRYDDAHKCQEKAVALHPNFPTALTNFGNALMRLGLVEQAIAALTTLAPQSASCRTQVGPERTRVRSSTVKRDRACEARGKGIPENSDRDQAGIVWRGHHRRKSASCHAPDRRIRSLQASHPFFANFELPDGGRSDEGIAQVAFAGD